MAGDKNIPQLNQKITDFHPNDLVMFRDYLTNKDLKVTYAQLLAALGGGNPISFTYPVVWVFDGDRTYTLPTGGAENWVLSDLLKAHCKSIPFEEGLDTFPDLGTIVLKDGWSVGIGDKIYMKLKFIYG